MSSSFDSLSDKALVIEWPPHVGLALVLDLQAIGVPLIPELDDLGGLPAVGTPRLDHLARAEAEVLLCGTSQELLLQPLTVLLDVLPDEDEAALARLGSPLPLLGRGEAPAEEHVDALEDVLLIASLHGQHTLVSEEIVAHLPDQHTNPLFQKVHVQFEPRHGPSHTGDRGVVHMVVRACLQELWVHLQNPIQIEGVQHQQLLRIHSGELGANDGSRFVDAPDAGLQLLQRLLLFFGFQGASSSNRLSTFHILALLPFAHLRPGNSAHQIALVQDDAICEGQLFHRLILCTLGLLLIQVLLNVCRVHHCDDAVQSVLRLDLLIHKEGLRHWRRICHAGGLDEHCIELLDLAVHALQGAHQIASHSATNAAVHDFDHLLLGTGLVCDELFIHSHLPELILDDREAEAMTGVRQDLVQEGGLPGSQKSRQDRHRDTRLRHGHWTQQGATVISFEYKLEPAKVTVDRPVPPNRPVIPQPKYIMASPSSQKGRRWEAPGKGGTCGTCILACLALLGFLSLRKTSVPVLLDSGARARNCVWENTCKGFWATIGAFHPGAGLDGPHHQHHHSFQARLRCSAG